MHRVTRRVLFCIVAAWAKLCHLLPLAGSLLANKTQNVSHVSGRRPIAECCATVRLRRSRGSARRWQRAFRQARGSWPRLAVIGRRLIAHVDVGRRLLGRQMPEAAIGRLHPLHGGYLQQIRHGQTVRFPHQPCVPPILLRHRSGAKEACCLTIVTTTCPRARHLMGTSACSGAVLLELRAKQLEALLCIGPFLPDVLYTAEVGLYP